MSEVDTFNASKVQLSNNLLEGVYMDNEKEDRTKDVIGNENIESVDTSPRKNESLLVAGY